MTRNLGRLIVSADIRQELSRITPLTINEHTVKDTFDAKSPIQTINQALFSQGYQYVSFDVESLFTNVPLEI